MFIKVFHYLEFHKNIYFFFLIIVSQAEIKLYKTLFVNDI